MRQGDERRLARRLPELYAASHRPGHEPVLIARPGGAEHAAAKIVGLKLFAGRGIPDIGGAIDTEGQDVRVLQTPVRVTDIGGVGQPE